MYYTALIVDDERPARTTLSQFIREYLPQINSIHEAESVQHALEVLSRDTIDIVFLDIQMPNSNGFELIRYLSRMEQHVIFVTAYSNYTYQAIKASAVDYLMKPLMIEELIEAATKTFQRIDLSRNAKTTGDNNRLTELLEYLTIPQSKTININHSNGFEMVNLDDVLYLEASKSYTIFHLKDQREIIASRNIAYFEPHFEEPHFVRIHKSYIINWKHLNGYSAIDGHFALIDGGKKLPVSKRKLNDFLKLSKA
jgi:two-component system LytT family response regulator